MHARIGEDVLAGCGCRYRADADRLVLVRDCGGHAGEVGTPEVPP